MLFVYRAGRQTGREGAHMHRKRLALVGAVVAALAVAAVAGASTKSTTINLVAYSTPKPVMTKIIQDFQQTPEGKDVSFNASYGASTAQAKAVEAGLPADIVLLNTGNDMIDLVNQGIINKNWDKQSYKGLAFHSVVVFGLRDGNPKHIKGWNDLIKPGVQVVSPNPFTAG